MKNKEESAAQALKHLIEVSNKVARRDGDNLYGHPNHCHNVPGKWDRDGSRCEECAAWDAARLVANNEAPPSMLELLSPALVRFKEAYEFMEKAKADKSDSVYETGAMKDAVDWVESASSDLFKAMVEVGFTK